MQGGTTITFGYNGVGDRLSQTVGLTTTHYVLDPGAGLTQVLADGTNTYLYGNDRLAQYQAAMQYFGADGLGSVRQIFDASATVVGGSRYDPFGSVMSQSGSATSVYGYTGEQYDAATGLTYLRARNYSSATGRFITSDPSRLEANAYLYAGANPVNRTDPAGMVPAAPPSGKIPRTENVICRAPDLSHTDSARAEITYWKGDVYIYCGEFNLTAYQFVEDEGYPVRITMPTPAPGRPPIPTSVPPANVLYGMAQGTINGRSFTVNARFAADVSANGTGHTGNTALGQICSTGYFHMGQGDVTSTYNDVNNVPMTFNAACGKGRDFDPIADAYRVAATDVNQVPRNAFLYIPGLALPAGSGAPANESPNVTARDSGGEIIGYRLDIFVGQGRGILSYTASPRNTLSNLWSTRHGNLGDVLIDRPGGGQLHATAPTSVYQRVPPGNPIISLYYSGGSCGADGFTTQEEPF